MFKHLTHTLKLGLTTLTILTAGAGAAFAQPAGFATAIDPIADCLNAGSRGPSYCTVQVANCIHNPFGTNTYHYGTGGCATTLGTKAHTVAKVRYCQDQDVPSVASKATTHPCSDTWGGVNAAMWAKQNPDAPDSPDTVRPRHQFLKGGAAGLDPSGITVINSRRNELYLDIATFDGKALGGDATDGVAFITSVGAKYYSGILSGTDLGAPVDNPAGTTASWVGQFQAVNFTTNRDFVLEITFGHAEEGKAGSIEAFVYRQRRDHFSRLVSHFHLKGDFDDSGLITGTVVLGKFTGNNRDNQRGSSPLGVLTGLIGQDGAVGIFHSNGRAQYSGGFVARPADLVVDENDVTAQAFLNTRCSEDPFTNKNQEFCYLEYADDRVTRINDCITGGNASDASQCGTAIAEHECINNPFASDCADDFTDYYETARANRIQFCLDSTTIDNIKTSNLKNSLCTNSDTVAAICTYAPFASICFDGDTYKTTRADKINDCRTNTTDPSCTGVTASPNAVAWEYRLKNRDDNPIILTSAPSTTNRRNQFLKDLEDKSAGNLDSGEIKGDITVQASGSLNLQTATFNGTTPLGGDAADGVAYFSGRVNGQGPQYHYAGIFSGTDLGAPVTQTSGTASWVGRFQAINFTTNEEFVLEIDFDGTGDKAGYIKAFVQARSWSRHFYIDGSYNAHGVITGTVDFGIFTNDDRDGSTRTPNGTLTGLIGQDGAVGAFHSNHTGGGGYAGGFVARPANDADKVYLNRICDEDPFGYLCYLETDKQRDKIIECTEGSNAGTPGCARAVQLNSCLTNPFATNCKTDFADYYVAAREKRAAFCVGDLTNSLCTGTGATDGICTYAPFASICFSGSSHDTTRASKYTFCSTGTNVTDPSCTGVMDNPNALAWAADSSVTVADSADINIATRSNQFLKGGATALSNAGFTDDDVVSGSVSLATATFGGDASDGVAFFRGRHSDGTKHYYAGILSGTDLGGPLTETTGSANWKGSFQYISGFDDSPNIIDFTLKVNFSNPKAGAAGSISGNVPLPVFGMWAITGDFNDKGIIEGHIDWTFGRIGNVTGLIGQQGAVGAFYAVNGLTFSGGFVACPYDSVNNRCER